MSSAPVLKDLAGREFTEGDFVVYSSVNGIRYGRVDWIKELPKTQWDLDTPYKVYVELSFHNGLTKEPGKMYVKRMGYRFVQEYFLKVTELQ